MKNASTRASSWLKVPTSAFTQQVLTHIKALLNWVSDAKIIRAELVGTFNQEKILVVVEAFSVVVKTLWTFITSSSIYHERRWPKYDVDVWQWSAAVC